MSDPKMPGAMNNEMLDYLKNKGQDMVQHFQKMQADLEKTEIAGVGGVKDSDGIFVEVVLNGLQQVKKVNIGDGAMDEGKEVVADLLAAALNSAMEKLKGVMQQQVMGVYEKSGLPVGENKEADE